MVLKGGEYEIMKELDPMEWRQETEGEIKDLKFRVEAVEQQTKEFQDMTKKMQEEYDMKLQSVKNDVQSVKNDVKAVSNSQQELKYSVEKYGENNEKRFGQLLDHSLGIKTLQEETNAKLQLAKNKTNEKVSIARLGTREKIYVSLFGGGIAGIVLAVPAVIEAIAQFFK